MRFGKVKLLAFIFAAAISALTFKGARETKAEILSPNTLDTAEPIGLDGASGGTFKKYDKAHYYRLDIPNDMGNKDVGIYVTNYMSGGIGLRLLNSSGAVIAESNYISTNENGRIYAKADSSWDQYEDRVKLYPGNTYYVNVYNRSSWDEGHGDYKLSIESWTDDSWGGFDNASELKANEKYKGSLELSTDIDSYYINLPEKTECNFILSSDKPAYVQIADENGIKINDTKVYKDVVNDSLSVIGTGQKVTLRIWSSDNQYLAYTIKPVVKGLKNSIKLTKYTAGTYSIEGKTLKNSDVQIKIGKDVYEAKADEKGKFSVSLSRKLKSKGKIKVTVTKDGVKVAGKTFKAK